MSIEKCRNSFSECGTLLITKTAVAATLMHMTMLTITTTTDELIDIARAAQRHCDGWRSAFIPLVDEDEVLDTQHHWSPIMAAALRNDLHGLLNIILAETAFYAAVDYKTRERWNFYSDVSFLEWQERFPRGVPFVMDARDPLISREQVLRKLQQWSKRQPA